jgi:hypothetical protein
MGKQDTPSIAVILSAAQRSRRTCCCFNGGSRGLQASEFGSQRTRGFSPGKSLSAKRQSATEWVPHPCDARVGKHDPQSTAVIGIQEMRSSSAKRSRVGPLAIGLRRWGEKSKGTRVLLLRHSAPSKFSFFKKEPEQSTSVGSLKSHPCGNFQISVPPPSGTASHSPTQRQGYLASAHFPGLAHPGRPLIARGKAFINRANFSPLLVT